MKNLFLFLSIFVSSVYGQNVIKGSVTNTYGSSVEYVNIGVVGTSKGVISNEKGFFTMDISGNKPTDSLYFSHLSYHRKTIAIKDLKINSENKISLQEQDIELSPVIVSSKALKMKTLKPKGVRVAGGVAILEKKDTQQRENLEQIGDFLETKNEWIAKEFHITCIGNTAEKVVLRLNFYKVEEDGELTPLVEKPIYINVPKVEEKTDIVEYFWVSIPKGKIWIGLDVVDIQGDENLGVRFPLSFSGGWSRADNSFEKLPLGVGISFAIKGYKMD